MVWGIGVKCSLLRKLTGRVKQVLCICEEGSIRVDQHVLQTTLPRSTQEYPYAPQLKRGYRVHECVPVHSFVPSCIVCRWCTLLHAVTHATPRVVGTAIQQCISSTPAVHQQECVQ